MARLHLVVIAGTMSLVVSISALAEPGPDFNGDGFDDIAIGNPRDNPNPKDTWGKGSVHVIYGSGAGLSGAGDQSWSQDSAGIPTEAEFEETFGRELAWGDFNGDGFDDLAIHVRETIGEAYGAVHVLYGSGAGLTADGNQFLMLPESDAPAYGTELASGDFNGDGRDDLAIRGEHPTLGSSSENLVHVLYGTDDGLSAANEQIFHDDLPGLEGEPGDPGEWGFALASGDFNGDGFDDLAVGSSLAWVNGLQAAGKVQIIYGTADGLSLMSAAVGPQLFHQGTPGIHNSPEVSDQFGSVLEVGDFNGDAFADLAVAAPNEDDATRADHGVVHIIYGSNGGLTAAGTQVWDQGKPGIKGNRQAGDFFGWSFAAGDCNGDGRDDLAIGVPRDSVDGEELAGAVNVIYGSNAGLTSSNNRLLTQNQPELDDQFGYALTSGDYNGDGRMDLAVGAPYDTVPGSIPSRGVVNVFMGRSGNLGFKLPQTWHRGKPGITGLPDWETYFGYEL